MNFTREPIIETVITPREGNKLLIRSSKKRDTEEYQVDAVEIISFGQSLFFRSLERPKAFLLPITDYEVVEIKETRMALKGVVLEKPIKIGSPSSSFTEKPQETKSQKRRSKRKRRHPSERAEEKVSEEVPPSIIRRLFPPPPTLIQEKLSRSKKSTEEEEELLPPEIEEAMPPLEEEKEVPPLTEEQPETEEKSQE